MEGYKANLNTDDGEVISLILTNASADDGSVSSFMFGIPNKPAPPLLQKKMIK